MEFRVSGCVPGILGAVGLELASSFGVNAHPHQLYLTKLICWLAVGKQLAFGGLSAEGRWRSTTAMFDLLFVLLFGFAQAGLPSGPPRRRRAAAGGCDSLRLRASAPLPWGPASRPASTTQPSGYGFLRTPRPSWLVSCCTMAATASSARWDAQSRASPVWSVGEPGRPSRSPNTGPPVSVTSCSDSKPSGSGTPPSSSPLGGAPDPHLVPVGPAGLRGWQGGRRSAPRPPPRNPLHSWTPHRGRSCREARQPRFREDGHPGPGATGKMAEARGERRVLQATQAITTDRAPGRTRPQTPRGLHTHSTPVPRPPHWSVPRQPARAPRGPGQWGGAPLVSALPPPPRPKQVRVLGLSGVAAGW